MCASSGPASSGPTSFGATRRDSTADPAYDALLLVSFGGPERREDVMPFLENVVRGRRVPRERLFEVAQHYYHFEGVSPLNEQNRRLLESLRTQLQAAGRDMPIYWGNRNWDPYLTDTLAQMSHDGIRRALAFVTSVFSSYSGCRQYRENIADAQRQVGDAAPRIDKLRVFFNHPLFIATVRGRVADAIDRLPTPQRDSARLVFTAHSIPASMSSGCEYERQLAESSRLVAEAVSRHAPSNGNWDLVYQSRSGPPQVPWLQPDICDYLTQGANRLRDEGVVIVPIGFVSDHLEVLYDLDVEAADVCRQHGIPFARAATPGDHPDFVRMILDLIDERTSGRAARAPLGAQPASHAVCPEDCCLEDTPPAHSRRRASGR
jgi:ferrochelatase